MKAVIFVGIQGSGKTTFYRERFFDTHVRINLDMLRTRHRERILFQACIDAKQPFVVDNTNPTRKERAVYVESAKAAGFHISCYYFRADLQACKQRNQQRPPERVVPLVGLLGTYKRLVAPGRDEGFDEMRYVHIDGRGGFSVEEWSDEV